MQPPHQRLLAALKLSKSLRAVSSAQARLGFGAEAAAALQRALAVLTTALATSEDIEASPDASTTAGVPLAGGTRHAMQNSQPEGRPNTAGATEQAEARILHVLMDMLRREQSQCEQQLRVLRRTPTNV